MNKFIFNKSKAYSICSPYFIPLMHGWIRSVSIILNKIYFKIYTAIYFGKNGLKNYYVVYTTPCGLRICDLETIAEYLEVN